MKRGRRLAGITGVLIAILLGLIGTNVATAAPEITSDNPFARGPDPTNSSIEAERGPFAIATEQVGGGNGFGGGTITYPTDTSQGTFGAIAVSPGFTGPEATIAWYGPRLASQGFVVIRSEEHTSELQSP